MRFNSNTTTNDGNNAVFHRNVYVHPLSQIILEHLQDEQSDWILQKGLERSLNIHRDGSFELHFSSSSSSSSDNDEKGDRIWTSYDEQEKKHWLSVQRGSLYERFLLQDNLLSAWNDNRKSLPERVQMAVDEMIRAIEQRELIDDEELDDQQQQQPQQTKEEGTSENPKDDPHKT